MPASVHHSWSCQNDPSGARGLHLQGWQAHVVGWEGWRKVTGPFLLKTQSCETLTKQSRSTDELIYVTKAFFIFQSYHRILLKVKRLSIKTLEVILILDNLKRGHRTQQIFSIFILLLQAISSQWTNMEIFLRGKSNYQNNSFIIHMCNHNGD